MLHLPCTVAIFARYLLNRLLNRLLNSLLSKLLNNQIML
uniref:Uncharacterized protein n=1 Tax=Siphoviridae sp. cteEJ17 TaxID=2827904 RepID=A0A8S5T0Y0_9CAUD|nr:MAG TPA: hypothetical protein [Siphoviridae sp. cteEJ17]DAV05852.1 MAG TPA: hypothetical protein [Caudoviricetes sp.]